MNEKKKSRRVRVNIQAPRNIKIAKNVVRGNSTSRANAEQHVEIRQQGGRDASDDADV